MFLPLLVFDLFRNPWVLARFFLLSLPNMFFDQLMINGLFVYAQESICAACKE
jgi:hypothetical protein